ncbi:ABC transporter substrate-binding protein [Streptococcus sp. S784/96/1]|uniref:ABC transporter substrate-binding protein n=1 Tax=Streptococcus sp. S784/96/1 TaxID=2653499 RepID=UPI00192E4495|nr:ABC transporter substrate-binding protein [Streptococcus sp. S784/96/1]
MKRKFISLLTLVCCGALVACTSSKESQSDSSSEIVVDVFNIKTETAEQMDALVEKFEENHPGIDINMTTVGGGTDAAAALQAKFSSGDEPDLFMLGGLSDAKTWEHTLYDLKDSELASLAIDGTLEGATLNDKVLGLPMNIEGYGWLVNKEIFKKAGISLEDIKSFEDFKQAVEKLDNNKKSLGLDGVFAYSGGETWVSAQFSSNFIAPEYSDSLTDTANATELKLTYGDRMKSYFDLADKYNAKPIESLDYSTSVEELFASGKVAMIHQGNWIIPTLNSLDESFTKEKLGILPMFVEDETKGKIVAGPAWYWCVNSSTSKDEREAAITFLTWMYTDKEAMSDVLNEFNFIPAYTNFVKDEITEPLSNTIYTYLTDGNTVPWVHNSYPDGFGEKILGVQLQAYGAEQISWDDFKETISSTWQLDRK